MSADNGFQITGRVLRVREQRFVLDRVDTYVLDGMHVRIWSGGKHHDLYCGEAARMETAPARAAELTAALDHYFAKKTNSYEP